jgi:hypothetical protein
LEGMRNVIGTQCMRRVCEMLWPDMDWRTQVDSGFQSGMRDVLLSEANMDEVGAVRGRPDPAQFYSAMRFVDNIVKVADTRITQQLLDKLDAQFMRQTLAQRLLKGSEVPAPTLAHAQTSRAHVPSRNYVCIAAP